jgi:protein-S-isoprenylcysteine O-methyltransferase Ste14
MPASAYYLLAAGWIVWLLPFLLLNRKSQKAQLVDKRARLGIVLVMISYTLLWQAHFWERTPRPWQFALSSLLFVFAALLSWTGALTLGRQWRVDAGLNADHELVTAGPYRFIRHPIYSSLLGVLLGTGPLVTPWWLFVPALLLFIVGTEIRVRSEEKLLAGHFGDRFADYKRRVPSAYIPFLR